MSWYSKKGKTITYMLIHWPHAPPGYQSPYWMCGTGNVIYLMTVNLLMNDEACIYIVIANIANMAWADVPNVCTKPPGQSWRIIYHHRSVTHHSNVLVHHLIMGHTTIRHNHSKQSDGMTCIVRSFLDICHAYQQMRYHIHVVDVIVSSQCIIMHTRC